MELANHFGDGAWNSAADRLRLGVSVERNSSIAQVSLDGADAYPWPDDSVELRASMAYAKAGSERIVHRVYAEARIAELLEGEGFGLELGAYGPFTLEATLRHDGEGFELPALDFAAIADHYDIALLGGSYPPLLFAAALCREDGPGSKGPAIVYLQRSESWKTDSLPAEGTAFYGVYPIPFLDRSPQTSQPRDWGEENAREWEASIPIRDYIAVLRGLDPSSTFSFYCSDRTPSTIESAVYANRLDEGSYDIVALSDGSGSYAKFQEHYAGRDDPAAWHDALCTRWLEIRDKARDAGEPCEFGSLEKLATPASTPFAWAVLDCEADARWWLANPDELGSIVDDAGWARHPLKSGKLVRMSIEDLLAGSRGIPERLEALYGPVPDFSEDDLVVLGTYGPKEDDLVDYLRFSLAWFKPAGRVFYKPHPSAPLSLYPGTAALLKGYGVIPLDASMPAEFLLAGDAIPSFAGYLSTSSGALCKAGRCGIFRHKGLEAAVERIEHAEWTMEPLSDSCLEKARELAAGTGATHLIEFSDELARKEGASWGLWNGWRGGAELFDASWERLGRKVALDARRREPRLLTALFTLRSASIRCYRKIKSAAKKAGLR